MTASWCAWLKLESAAAAQERKAREAGKQPGDKATLPRGQSGALPRGQSGTLPAAQAEARGTDAREERSPENFAQDSPGSGRTILYTMEKSEHEKEVRHVSC